jgi:general secretion pathway protein A
LELRLFISKSDPDLLSLKHGEKDRNAGQPSNFSCVQSSKIFAVKRQIVMSGNLDFKTWSDEVPRPGNFHNNLHYREVIATLRYGIEARKGLILLSGEPGTGKTTLLQKLLEELDPSVTCVVESDPGVNFTDLLRSILRHLHADGDPPDTVSMVDSCKAILRAHRDEGYITCLIIDNAQQLDELTLEYLMESFFPADSENSDNNILQVVLAGLPAVREKLLHPLLRPLNPHLGLLCSVEPLGEKDIGPYVADQLRARRFPADAIDQEAIHRIFEYTSGTPRLINDVCTRAVEIADASPHRRITQETVVNAAHEVGLSEIWRSRKTKTNVMGDFPREPKQREQSFDFEVSEAQTTDMLMQTFLQDTPRRGRRWFGSGLHSRKGMHVLLPLVLVFATAGWIERDMLAVQVGRLNDGLKAITGLAESPARRSAETDVPPARAEGTRDPVALPRSAIPAEGGDNGVATNSPPPARRSAEQRSLPAAENTPEPEPTPLAKTAPAPAIEEDQQGSRAEPLEARSRQLEALVQKAILNRAINGIEVSVVNGTAVLQGRVASERQKQAAERAANSVGGVQRVRNRIVVG